MMKKFSLAILVLIISACGGDDDPTPISAEFLAGNTSKTWYFTDWEGTGFASFEDELQCVKDDRWVFYANGTMEQNEGPSKCDPADPQIYVTGSWVLSVESNTLTLTRSTIVNFTVKKLTENALVITSGSSKYYFAKE